MPEYLCSSCGRALISFCSNLPFFGCGHNYDLVGLDENLPWMITPYSPNPLNVRVVMTMLPSPWQTAIFSTSVMISFLGIDFSVHGTPLSLQSFLCSSSKLGCLRAWQFPLHFLVSESAYPHYVSHPLQHRLVGQS